MPPASAAEAEAPGYDVIASRRSRLAPPLLLALALTLSSRAARAQAPSSNLVLTRLTYTAPRGCPDERAFRVSAVGYLGARDPFNATAGALLDVKITHTGGTYWGEVTGTDANGRPLGKPNTFHDPDCTQVVEAAAFVAGVWLSRRVAHPPAPMPAPAGKPEPPSRVELPPDDRPATPPPVAVVAPPPKPPVSLRAGGMVGVDVRPGTLPAFGVVADVGLKVWKFSVEAQFHAVPAARPTVGGADTTLVAGGLVACWRFEDVIGGQPLAFPLCVMGEGGQIQPQGGPNPRDAAGPFAGGGVGLGIEIAMGKTPLYISAAGELLGMVQPGIAAPPLVVGTIKGLAGGAHTGVGFTF